MPENISYKVGVVVPGFCDQAYLRDRDEIISAASEESAIQQWIKNHDHWIRPDEHKFVQVIK